MKNRIFITTLLAAGVALASTTVAASDELAGAIVLGGTGAVLGHAIGGQDGAVIGGFLGAILGAAAADDNDRHRDYRGGRDYRRISPPVHYMPPPPSYRWRDEWRERHDGRWNGDNRRWNDNGWRDNDGRRGGHRDNHGDHHGW